FYLLFFFNVSLYVFFFFFFSSRRRHTRFSRDWSSDVCSSDLVVYLIVNDVTIQTDRQDIDSTQVRTWRKEVVNQLIKQHAQLYLDRKSVVVGKECRSRWSPYH